MTPDQTHTDTDNRIKPIVTDYLQGLSSISANFTDNNTDTDTDMSFKNCIKPIPIAIPIIGIGNTDLADYQWNPTYMFSKIGPIGSRS